MDRTILALSLCALPTALRPSVAARAETLADLWASARRGGTYQPASAGELREARALFQRTLLGRESALVLKQDWARLRFDLIVHRQDAIEWLLLRERDGHKTGRGFYVFRRGQGPAVALQAPHGWDDLHTGPIGLLLVQQGQLAAGAWNTVARAEADLAHLPACYFQAFTEAFSAVHPRGGVVQLHGFDKARRRGPAACAEAVVSGGTKRPPLWVRDVTQRWKAVVSDRVKLYPSEVRELGGTTNAQAQLLDSLGHEGFLHVEMSLGLRKRLRDESTLREALLNGLLGAYAAGRDRGLE